MIWKVTVQVPTGVKAAFYIEGDRKIKRVMKGHNCFGMDVEDKLTVWTYGYRPFVMGGSVNYVLATQLPMSVPEDLGHDFQGHVIEVPNSKEVRIVESRSGAIIGNSLKDVRKDVRTGKPDVMEAQVTKALKDFESMDVKMLKPDEFWEQYLK